MRPAPSLAHVRAHPQSSHRHRDRRGMTLVEILISMALASMFSVAAIMVFIQVINTYHYEVGKLMVNKDIRALTSQMTDNATYANYFLVMPSYSNRTETFEVTAADGTTEKVTVDSAVNDGESGDCLLLVFKDVADDTKVSRLVGYYRSPNDPTDPSSEGPVRRFEIAISPSSSAPIWTLMPPVDAAEKFPQVIELSEGLADGNLFYNYRDRSVMVKGKIIHQGSLVKRATNTYNFTISPRG